MYDEPLNLPDLKFGTILFFVSFAVKAPWKMDSKYHFSCHLNLAFVICVMLCLTGQIANGSSLTICKDFTIDFLHNEALAQVKDKLLNSLNEKLLSSLRHNDLNTARADVNNIIKYISACSIKDSAGLDDSYYLSGVFFLKNDQPLNGLKYIEKARILRESMNLIDARYSNILYNTGWAYNNLDDFDSAKTFYLRSLELEKKLYGSSSPSLLQTYSALLGCCIGLKEYDDVKAISETAIAIIEKSSKSEVQASVADIYTNSGVALLHLADYNKAVLYLEKALGEYNKSTSSEDPNSTNLLNNLAIAYSFLGYFDKANECYQRNLEYCLQNASSGNGNFINNYAVLLAKQGRKTEGEKLLQQAVETYRSLSGGKTNYYFELLSFYANYLNDPLNEHSKACEYFELSIQGLKKSGVSQVTLKPIYLGYAQALAANGDINAALRLIQSLLFNNPLSPETSVGNQDLLINPSTETLVPDKMTLNALNDKHWILWRSYQEKPDLAVLKSAAELDRLIIRVLEKMRMNISEEESRLILGDRFRNTYVSAVSDLYLLFKSTGEEKYLESAYECMEKSKVAGLLAASREMGATMFNIPASLSGLENKLRKDITYLNADLEDQQKGSIADSARIKNSSEKLLILTQRRDSLISKFEKNYPGYYSFKYNSDVTSFRDIPSAFGRSINYLNYLASDTCIFIFIANRKGAHLVSIPTDSTFFGDIRRFRSLLGIPSHSRNAREDFKKFQTTGYTLYQKIIEPVLPFLVSDKLLISPDNILSYIPFETLPSSPDGVSNLSYAKIPYLMNRFDISYAYSVTFQTESMKRRIGFTNRLAAFAPAYHTQLDLNSVLNRQTVNGILPELPYAQQEAEYVSKVTRGALFAGADASETGFKKVSGSYDIIHLAMHTVLNDKKPMYSTLIFSSERDLADDGLLHTYEVYTLPLNAKMVVLSSCNSGAGYLYTGEGILSLARGFLYSGSQSVVMAMWEIEDKSGTEIIKGFYDNLRKGYSKSSSLRRARKQYLEEADQLRSHPYFWSSLVIYGSNEPIYYSRYLKAGLLILGMVILLLAGVYFWRRTYS
jgi:CHAT domain-containing protein